MKQKPPPPPPHEDQDLSNFPDWASDFPMLRFKTFQGDPSYIHADEISTVTASSSTELEVSTHSGKVVYSDFALHTSDDTEIEDAAEAAILEVLRIKAIATLQSTITISTP